MAGWRDRGSSKQADTTSERAGDGDGDGWDLLPGLANMLINGVNSEGLRRCAMCSLRPVGPWTPVEGC